MRELRVADHLGHDTLTSLVEGKLDLIRCRAYCPPEDYATVRPRIHAACDASTYTLTDDLQCVGVSIGEANESAVKAAEYLERAAGTTEFIRHHLFGGVTSPGDRFLAELDALWPAGAEVARSGGVPVLQNVIRRWVSGGQANPHIDQRGCPLLGDYTFRKRLGVNVYLEMPPEGQGGDLELWDVLIEDEARYLSERRPDYGLNREDLAVPDWVVHPGDGDLFVFDAARLHAVRGLSGGRRVTMACFVGVRGSEEPLVLFA
ncbi:hypothetical protein ACF1AX_20095 [Streptomyces sp. NPDC014802]|uniref:hypothetical protein n=1 Tax=unclassified Streptomyces TaxID=2593676 RepID=UPI0036FB57F2